MPLQVANPTVKLVEEVRALIDTGATTSVISDRLAQRLRLKTVGAIDVLVAGGRKEQFEQVAVRVIVPNAHTGQAVFLDGPIAAAPSSEDMILGMDVMLNSTLVVDGLDETWEWSFYHPDLLMDKAGA